MSLLVLGAIVVATSAIAGALMVLVRRRMRHDYLSDNPSRLTAIFGVVGTAFAVVLAFVVLSAYESYQDASRGAEAEAVAVLELSRTASFLGPGVREQVQAGLACYGRAVVSDGWRTMREGERSRLVDHWVVELGAALHDAALETSAEEAAFRAMLDQQRDRAAGRRERVSESAATIPAPVWFILILGGVLTTAFVLLFADRRERPLAQVLAIAMVAAVVSSGLALVWFLDHPYGDGSGSIEPAEMRRTISIMAAEQPRIEPPCDARGAPRGAGLGRPPRRVASSS